MSTQEYLINSLKGQRNQAMDALAEVSSKLHDVVETNKRLVSLMTDPEFLKKQLREIEQSQLSSVESPQVKTIPEGELVAEV